MSTNEKQHNLEVGKYYKLENMFATGYTHVLKKLKQPDPSRFVYYKMKRIHFSGNDMYYYNDNEIGTCNKSNWDRATEIKQQEFDKIWSREVL